MYKLILILALAGTIAACSSPVKLNEVSVEDKSGQASVGMKTLTPATTAAAGDKKSNVATRDTTAGAKSATGTDALAAATARTIYFEFDSFAIRPEYQAIIETHARNLKANKNQRISIDGHTDERGGSEYNIALGQKRAEAVRRALNALGVADGQIEAVSYGKEKPALAGTDEAVFAKNRRAEITYR